MTGREDALRPPSCSANALVVGGTGALGTAIVEALLNADMSVAYTSRTVRGAPGAITCEVTSPASVQTTFEDARRFLGGQIGVVIVNAGISMDRSIRKMEIDDFESVLQTNTSGAFTCVKNALPDMLEAGWGRVVLISSVSAFHGLVGQVNYAASKSALVGLARSVAREVGPRGVTVNVVVPGFVEGGLTKGIPHRAREAYERQIPLRRFAQPAEIANIVRFVASPETSYVNGAVLAVDGGFGMGLG